MNMSCAESDIDIVFEPDADNIQFVLRVIMRFMRLRALNFGFLHPRILNHRISRAFLETNTGNPTSCSIFAQKVDTASRCVAF